MILQLYQLSCCFYHDTIVYHDSTSNDKMQNSTWIILYIARFMHIMSHQNKSKHKLIIAQWIIHTRRTIMWSTQTTLINKSFNFIIILRFKCLIYVYHDNKKLYHITIMDLCDRYYHTIDIIAHHYLFICMMSKQSPMIWLKWLWEQQEVFKLTVNDVHIVLWYAFFTL